MAAKKKKTSKKPVAHGWEGHGMGQPPFPGAAPPIHLQKRKKTPKKKGK